MLLADEPTTALDVTIQAQILELLDRLRRELDLAVVLITHDLAVVAETCERVVVMYAGSVVEEAPAATLFAAPSHPYTRGLLAALPRLGQPAERGKLPSIPGQVPDAAGRPPAAPSILAAPTSFDRCLREAPPADAVRRRSAARAASCTLPPDDRDRPAILARPRRRRPSRCCAATGIEKHFVLGGGLLRRDARRRARRRRRRPRGRAGRVPGPGGGVGQRQDDARALPDPPARADLAPA